MINLSCEYADTFNSEKMLTPAKYDFQSKIMPIMKERSRFKEIVDFIDKFSNHIGNEDFSEAYTNHYFIHCSELNDGLVASIAICNMIYEKYSYDIGEYMVNRSVVNPTAKLKIGKNTEMGLQLVVRDADISSEDIIEFVDDDEEDEYSYDDNPSVFLFHETTVEKIFRFDYEGVKVCFVIYVDNLVNESGITISPKQVAEKLCYTYLDIPSDSKDDLALFIANKLCNYGFDVQKVHKQIKLTADNPLVNNEYSAVAVATKIMNKHISSFGEISPLHPSDFDDFIVSAKHGKNNIKLIGLEKELEIIEGMVNTLTLDIERNRRNISGDISGCNMVFAGPPGTAKTTLAREFARILSERRLIPGIENFRECVKSDIVGQYVGQTARQVDNMFRELNHNGGGVIFFDEIYSLSEKDSTSYDKEAVTCIIKNMEDYRNGIFCIFAGYENKMKEFMESNPGLNSRITTTIRFKAYDNETLCRIFDNILQKNNFKVKGAYTDILTGFFDKLRVFRKESFGNGRETRNLFENAKRIMAGRVCKQKKYTKALLTTIYAEEIKKASDEILNSVIKDNVSERKAIGF